MPIKLFVFDFDGTALGGHVPYERFPEQFASFLDDLGRHGIQWATNTTWAPAAQSQVITRSGVKSDPAFLAGGTGIHFAYLRGGELTHDIEHGKEMLARQKRFHKKNWPVVRGILQSLLREELVDGVAYNSEYCQCMVTFHCQRRNSARAWARLEPLLRSGEFYSWSNDGGRTGGALLPHFMNKGEAVIKMRRLLGLDPESVLVAGDGVNDLHMFEPEVARWCVCPDNADPVVKAAVRKMGGVIASQKFSWGVVEGANELIKRAGQGGGRSRKERV